MGGLALLFLAVLLIEPLNRDPTLSLVLSIVVYVLWAAFVAELAFRLWAAPDRREFLIHNWWRMVILAVPFLRLFALLRIVRVAAFSQLVSSAIRGSASATHLLSGRLLRLGVFTVIVVFAAAHLVYLFDGHASYPRTLHDVALTTIAGQPLRARSGAGQVIEILLAAYSVLVFATLAGSIGAYFLDEKRGQPETAAGTETTPPERREPS